MPGNFLPKERRPDDEERVGDAELLRGYVDGRSEAAFAELVRRHLDLVYSAALRQVGGDVHRAHDVCQIVFVTLARKAGSLAGHPVLAGWLYTATQHAAAKAVRTESRRRARELEAHLMQETLAPENVQRVRALPVSGRASVCENGRSKPR
jgi:DNA-directed RNA polymerase specialized sigma24 family protein